MRAGFLFSHSSNETQDIRPSNFCLVCQYLTLSLRSGDDEPSISYSLGLHSIHGSVGRIEPRLSLDSVYNQSRTQSCTLHILFHPAHPNSTIPTLPSRICNPPHTSNMLHFPSLRILYFAMLTFEAVAWFPRTVFGIRNETTEAAQLQAITDEVLWRAPQEWYEK